MKYLFTTLNIWAGHLCGHHAAVYFHAKRINESLENSRTPPVTPPGVKRGRIPQLLPNARGRRVSALERAGSSDPFLNPHHQPGTSPDPHPRCAAANTWLEVKDGEQQTLRQVLYIYIFFVPPPMPFNPFQSLFQKRKLAARCKFRLWGFQSKWCNSTNSSLHCHAGCCIVIA